MDKRSISVIGCGRWGTFIAWYLDHIGCDVLLYGRESSANMRRLLDTRENGLLTLPGSVRLCTDLDEAMARGTVVISVGVQGLRGLMAQLAAGYRLVGKTFVLCMKGIEIERCLRPTQIVNEYAPEAAVAVWLGPGHVQEFTAGTPNCMVIDSGDEAVKHALVDAFSSELIRFYYGTDLVGNEIGAAAKNVIGVAAGLLDGLGLSSLKGALTARGAREIGRLIKAMGGSELSAYGLCHLGDYGATVFSPFSQNRTFGEAYAKGEQYGKLAEGVHTVRALVALSGRYGVELPICAAVHATLHEGLAPAAAIERLFERSLKNEF